MHIAALSTRQGTSRRNSFESSSSSPYRVPFRDSVLTWMLKESLTGNSKTTMLATVSPSPKNYAETLSTLRYASSASQIKTKASVNIDPTSELITSLKQVCAIFHWIRSLISCTQTIYHCFTDTGNQGAKGGALSSESWSKQPIFCSPTQ